jgi:hypothetical protein
MLLEDILPRQVGAGNSHFPCPNGNGTQIGDVQKFNVLCGLDIGGVEIDRMQVDSLNTCVSIWYVRPICSFLASWFRMSFNTISTARHTRARDVMASHSDSTTSVYSRLPLRARNSRRLQLPTPQQASCPIRLLPHVVTLWAQVRFSS